VYLAWTASSQFLLLLIAYFLVSLAYSAWLKDIVLVDIFCISVGFMLRLQAGGVAFNVAISEWLFLSVFLLAVFLSAGKRLAEKQHLGDTAQHHRKALTAYPKGFLEGAMYMTGGSVLVTYTMYTLSRHSPLLLYSVPLCCFGLLRYMLRVQSGRGGDPTESLTRDVPLLMVGAAWVGLVGWGIYVS
jgi:4-hydroxybenzoate polyprenyltransferase